MGGASVWQEAGTEIWASAAFTDNFLKQYSLFQPAEALRGRRQYGQHVSREVLGCTSLGPLPDIDAATSSGARLPTRTFSAPTSTRSRDRVAWVTSMPSSPRMPRSSVCERTGRLDRI